MSMSGFAKITGLPVMTLTRINHALTRVREGTMCTAGKQ